MYHSKNNAERKKEVSSFTEDRTRTNSSGNVEDDLHFTPVFRSRDALLPCVVQDLRTKEILMLAYVNMEALERTIETGKATFLSRSKQSLWTKGETSGNYFFVRDIFVDCDQDAFVYQVEGMNGGACHTLNSEGRARMSCFYRRLVRGELEYRE